MDYLLPFSIEYAKEAHKGQVRKYTKEPYITHPLGVAGMAYAVTNKEEVFIAGVLHDVVEDTDRTLPMIQSIFGHSIARMVYEMTDISKPEDGNRATRKAIDRDFLSTAHPDTKTIKLADLIDNTKTIILFDSKFAKVYMKEKKLLLEVLKEGDPILYNIAEMMVDNYFNRRI